MKTKNSADVAAAIERELIARFGVPVEIRVDRGLEFAGAVDDLCVKLGIRKSSISVQHPQANG